MFGAEGLVGRLRFDFDRDHPAAVSFHGEAEPERRIAFGSSNIQSAVVASLGDEVVEHAAVGRRNALADHSFRTGNARESSSPAKFFSKAALGAGLSKQLSATGAWCGSR